MTLLSRKYKYWSTNYRLSFKADKSFNSELLIELVNESGHIEFHLFDESNNEVFTLTNPESNTYKFALEKAHKYLLKIISKSSVGSLKVSINK